MIEQPNDLERVGGDANPTTLAQMVVDQSEERLHADRDGGGIVLPEDALPGTATSARRSAPA